MAKRSAGDIRRTRDEAKVLADEVYEQCNRLAMLGRIEGTKEGVVVFECVTAIRRALAAHLLGPMPAR